MERVPSHEKIQMIKDIIAKMSDFFQVGKSEIYFHTQKDSNRSKIQVLGFLVRNFPQGFCAFWNDFYYFCEMPRHRRNEFFPVYNAKCYGGYGKTLRHLPIYQLIEQRGVVQSLYGQLNDCKVWRGGVLSYSGG